MSERATGHALRRTIVEKDNGAGEELSTLSWSCQCGEHLGDAPDVNTHGVRKIHAAHKAALNGSA